jgi:hypothetical protein
LKVIIEKYLKLLDEILVWVRSPIVKSCL